MAGITLVLILAYDLFSSSVASMQSPPIENNLIVTTAKDVDDSQKFRMVPSPTPDPPRLLPTLRTKLDHHTIKQGDTLGQIAQKYNISLEGLVQANNISNPDQITPGQVIVIPAITHGRPGPDNKILPDSEFVYGPSGCSFNLVDTQKLSNGYLFNYSEELDGKNISGLDIIQRVAWEYSINPKLLMAVLEYEGGWISNLAPVPAKTEYPIIKDPSRKSLYKQLSWTANSLNRGYYLWRVNAVSSWLTSDGSLVSTSNKINAGTAGIQYFMALLNNYSEWNHSVSPNGLYKAYQDLFGNPFRYSYEPLIPAGLKQPAFQLPFESGTTWSFTGGPHGGWGDGSGWAALDFAPPGNVSGCVLSNAWVVSIADGIILRSANGNVVEDVDNDGCEQSGWTILYQHIETRDRIQNGTRLKAGDRIGHPSCEGGVSNGTHVHIARRYNGEWIPADGLLPFVMDGWVSSGSQVEYNGYLKRNGLTIEAWDSRKNENQIQR
jgi:LasA protease